LNWLHFGRRFAYFSVKYVLFRLSQHGIVGASIGQRIVDRCGIGGVVIPVSLGELYGVWRR